jgi:hypothetical protein
VTGCKSGFRIVATLEVAAAFFDVTSVGICIAHAINDYRSRL